MKKTAESSAPAPKHARKPPKGKGHTIYLSDELFERVTVAAFRRGKTISQYIGGILDRQVPVGFRDIDAKLAKKAPPKRS